MLQGSPPRVRGKAFSRAQARGTNGITPACAGKRPWCRPRPRQCWDHPRVCGEKGLPVSVLPMYQGSPPRVRGKASAQFVYKVATRITPACAGKRLLRGARSRSNEDHPRVCGEKAKHVCRVRSIKGSPPRVRGKGRMMTGTFGESRITPACAGKSTTSEPIFAQY